jgi:outer membrane protein insertion porin family
MNESSSWRGARPAGCARRGIRFGCLFAAAALCQTVDAAAVDAADAKSAGLKKGSRAFRAQSPGYGNQYELTGGNPPSGPNSGPYSGPPANQAGQVPLRRTGPDSSAGYSNGTSRYSNPSYGTNGPAGRTVQYGGQPAAPGPSTPYYPGGYPPSGYGQPSYPPAGYAPGPNSPVPPSSQPGGLGPSGPYAQPGMPSGNLGPQGARPSVVPPGGFDGAGAPPGGLPPGAGPPPLGGYGSQGDLFSPDSPFNQPPLPVPITVGVQEGQTGKLMFGLGVNSNAGLIGNVTIDEQNFDWRKVPTSWEEVRNATAFRGGGQQLRISAMPGTVYSQYGVTFREPYLWDTKINFGIDGYYFNRYFQNWTEQRTGARVSFGYQLTPDLSTSLALKGENVGIFNPTLPAPPELTDVLGHNSLFVTSWTTVHDTRDSPLLPTQGHRISVDLEQGFGTFSFPRAILGLRQHFTMYERPDGSGRQVLSFLQDTGFTGSHTPIFENFFAGGYNTIRGFYFRGASPLDMGVQVGGKFEFLNTVEYMFPITGGDALRAVVFTDFGTVEPSTELKWNDFRIAPGMGLRVTIPAMGPAPIALDLAFPVHKAPGDRTQIFNFFVGVQR